MFPRDRKIFHVAVTLLCAAALPSCFTETSSDFDFRLGSDSKGEKGQVTFAYESSMCGFGCKIDHPVLNESLIRINIEGLSAEHRHSAMLRGNVGTLKPTSIQGSSSSCDIEVTQTGDAELVVLDENSAEVDSIKFKVRNAARFEIKVFVSDAASEKNPITAGGDGRYHVHQGAFIRVQTAAFDGDGARLEFTKHGISHDVADEIVIKRVDDPGSPTDVELLFASALGETNVRVFAPGAGQDLSFVIDP